MLLLGTVMRLRSRFSNGKSSKRKAAPSTVNGTVPPLRVENSKRRPREYLTVKEVTKLMEGARERRRYGHRDATMILISYRHGLRVSEHCVLRCDQIDFDRGFAPCASRKERDTERASARWHRITLI